MITESFAEGKHFFVAKILTKNIHEADPDAANHSFYYNAYSILRLLFKKKNDQFVGRFHERYPITVKNPITNAKIVGEVFFFKITNKRIERREQQELPIGDGLVEESKEEVPQDKEMSDEPDVGIASPEAKTRKDDWQRGLMLTPEPLPRENNSVEIGPEYLRGEFFGTDFNFIYSREMQMAFIKNCLAADMR